MFPWTRPCTTWSRGAPLVVSGPGPVVAIPVRKHPNSGLPSDNEQIEDELMKRLPLALIGSALVFTVACARTTAPVEPVVATLECEDGSGNFLSCELTLSERASLEIELTDRFCRARDNTVRLTSPIDHTLMTDGCYEPPLGTIWTFPGPFAAGTRVAMEFSTQPLVYPPSIRVSGEYPEWTLIFEDGGDADMYDIVLAVRAIPLD
jgi:hypothetical protein